MSKFLNTGATNYFLEEPIKGATKDLQPYVEAILEGASMNSQAKLAGVAPMKLRRLVLADPRYSAALAEGKVQARPSYTQADLQAKDHVRAVAEGGMRVAQASSRYGVNEQTLREHLRKAYPQGYGPKLAGAKPYWRGDTPVGGGRTTLAGSNNLSQAGAPEYHDPTAAPPSTNPQGSMPTLQIRLLPMISWATARDWEPDAGEIPQDQIAGWRAAARPSSPHSYVLTVEDPAMTAPPGAGLSFPVGCQIFVDAGRKDETAAGQRVVAKLHSSGQLVLRTLQADTATGRRWLEPLNPLFGVITQPFTVVGLVFGKWEDVEV